MLKDLSVSNIKSTAVQMFLFSLYIRLNFELGSFHIHK